MVILPAEKFCLLIFIAWRCALGNSLGLKLSAMRAGKVLMEKPAGSWRVALASIAVSPSLQI